MPRIDQLVEAKRKTKISLKLVVVFDCYFNVGYIILLNKIRPNQLFRRSSAHWQSDQISYFGRSGKDWQYRVPNWYEVVKRLWSLKFFFLSWAIPGVHVLGLDFRIIQKTYFIRF